MSKILIISYYYKHKNAMASVRAIKLAKFFAKQGHSVTVLTSNQKDTWTKEYLETTKSDDIREIYAPQIKRWSYIQKFLSHRSNIGEKKIAKVNASNQTSIIKNKFSVKRKIKSLLSWLFYFNLGKQEDICMYKGIIKEFKRQDFPLFDAVIATYPNYGSMLSGIWLKKRKKCKKFIADFRDPIYNPGFRNKKAESKYDLKCLKKIVNCADNIVCVSNGIADGIKGAIPDFNKPISIITNGYDLDDIPKNTEDIVLDKNKLNFVYTGTLYHGKRCVDMLALVLRELIDEEKIKTDDFTFHYAGPDFTELIFQLKNYQLEDTAVNHGFVSRTQAIALQKNAGALLLLTWNEKAYQGVVPGKLFEYMAIKSVPIIALITGDVSNSEVAQLINQTGSGCSCEEANDEDLYKLKACVYDIIKGNLKIDNCVEKFNYENISKEYLKIIK